MPVKIFKAKFVAKVFKEGVRYITIYSANA